MKSAEIIVKVDVLRVGYRDVVEKIARKLNINDYVENLKPYDVKIVAEGSEENVKKFIELIRIKKYPVNVETVDVNYKEATTEFTYFEIKRGDPQEELGERFDVAGALLYKSVELGEKSVALGEKMLEKQDTTISILRDIRRDTAHIPTMHEEIDDLKVKYERMEMEIGAIKSVLKVPC